MHLSIKCNSFSVQAVNYYLMSHFILIFCAICLVSCPFLSANKALLPFPY